MIGQPFSWRDESHSMSVHASERRAAERRWTRRNTEDICLHVTQIWPLCIYPDKTTLSNSVIKSKTISVVSECCAKLKKWMALKPQRLISYGWDVHDQGHFMSGEYVCYACFTDGTFSLCPHTVEAMRQIYWNFLSWPNQPPKPLRKCHRMGNEASPRELGETTCLQSVAQTVLRLIAITIENIKEEITMPKPSTCALYLLFTSHKVFWSR